MNTFRSLADFLGQSERDLPEQGPASKPVPSEMGLVTLASGNPVLGRIELSQTELSTAKQVKVLSECLATLVDDLWLSMAKQKVLSECLAETELSMAKQKVLSECLAKVEQYVRLSMAKHNRYAEAGRKGGRTRAARLSPERRHEIAQDGAKAQQAHRRANVIGFCPDEMPD